MVCVLVLNGGCSCSFTRWRYVFQWSSSLATYINIVPRPVGETEREGEKDSSLAQNLIVYSTWEARAKLYVNCDLHEGARGMFDAAAAQEQYGYTIIVGCSMFFSIHADIFHIDPQLIESRDRATNNTLGTQIVI